MPLRTRLIVLCLALAPLAAFAQSNASDALPTWEQLTPQQRDLLLAPVRERWNNSPPGKRRHMIEHAQRWQAMTPEQRKHARHGMKRWRDMPPEKRAQARALFEHLQTLPETERKAMVQRWKAMDVAERKAWVDAHPARQRAEED